ncbi:MAG: T9SS type A sorting domain-containing protein [Candidatus Marinimicrobia bacterium]|nr:T9SS type A sorting domain-containing protein [Candidatus Neomarinimicrobiota bacterium]
MKRFIILLLLISIRVTLFAQELTVEQIKTILLDNPPNGGDPVIREETILALENILNNDASRSAQSVSNFYYQMMNKVNTELSETVEKGAAIWMMYNHGFVIKTLNNVFAFDLVDGYSSWSGKLPAELLAQIDVLFYSHNHADHVGSGNIQASVMNRGGYVVIPFESPIFGNTPVAAGDNINLLGLEINAYNGLHSAASRIYEVTTSSGFKILHTGDNQTSVTLPNVENLDILLLNAWINESGSTSSVIGMRNSINKLKPEVMIPGHIQELGHSSADRARWGYKSAFAVDDVEIPAQVQVMAWGERYLTTDFKGRNFKLLEVNVSPQYVTPGTGSVVVTVRVENDSSPLTLFAEIDSLYGSPIDTIQLFDDGAHDDSAQGDNLFGNTWSVSSIEERLHSIDLLVTIADTVNFQMHNKGLFTTIGPVVYDSSEIFFNDGVVVSFKLFLKNEGLNTTAEKVTAMISTTDSCIVKIATSYRLFVNLAAGERAISSAYEATLNQHCSGDELIQFALDISSDGNFFWSDSFSIQLVPVGIADEGEAIPVDYALAQNYPNPFNPETVIEYALPVRSELNLIIYNLRGEEVARLIDSNISAGNHQVSWNASKVASGIYFYRLHAGDFVQTRKMILLK